MSVFIREIRGNNKKNRHMKKVIISLLALACLVACTPKKSPWAEYQQLLDTTIAQLRGDQAIDRDSLITHYVEQ